MFKVHGFIDNKKVLHRRMEHLPRKGDTMRFEDEVYAKVTELVWCMDEATLEGQRVNIRMKSIGGKNVA
jgi:hypothetical protein